MVYKRSYRAAAATRRLIKKSYRAAAAMVVKKMFQISLPRLYWTRNIGKVRVIQNYHKFYNSF
jgi:hypothetical protein